MPHHTLKVFSISCRAFFSLSAYGKHSRQAQRSLPHQASSAWCKVQTQRLLTPWHRELPLSHWAVLLLLISDPVKRRGAGLRAWSLVHTE